MARTCVVGEANRDGCGNLFKNYLASYYLKSRAVFILTGIFISALSLRFQVVFPLLSMFLLFVVDFATFLLIPSVGLINIDSFGSMC